MTIYSSMYEQSELIGKHVIVNDDEFRTSVYKIHAVNGWFFDLIDNEDNVFQQRDYDISFATESEIKVGNRIDELCDEHIVEILEKSKTNLSLAVPRTEVKTLIECRRRMITTHEKALAAHESMLREHLRKLELGEQS